MQCIKGNQKFCGLIFVSKKILFV